MTLEILGHSYQYELEKLTRLFFPNEKIRVIFEQSDGTDTDPLCRTEIQDNTAHVFCRFGERTWSQSVSLENVQDAELQIASMLFCALQELTGYQPKWGLLTGIRPSKLLLALQNEMGAANAHAYFRDRFFVSEEKTALTESVAAREESIIRTSRPDSCSLYVSIPFCPTRCSYCSFVSHAANSATAKKLLPDYVTLLTKEIAQTGAYAKTLGLRLESVYFGGGTPTTLSAEQLGILLSAVEQAFDLSAVREYTVEAGRPDTVTREKLVALKNGGVTRVSINPQSFTASIDRALALAPENITVHTLSLKRASRLGTQNAQVERAAGLAADEMLGYAYRNLTANAYHPYYMYRQSKTLGNLENTGYAKAGFECIYNIFMMEECHTVFAVGAGAVTKLKSPHGREIERIFNYKYPYEYISGFEEILARKEKILPFYEKYT